MKTRSNRSFYIRESATRRLSSYQLLEHFARENPFFSTSSCAIFMQRYFCNDIAIIAAMISSVAILLAVVKIVVLIALQCHHIASNTQYNSTQNNTFFFKSATSMTSASVMNSLTTDALSTAKNLGSRFADANASRYEHPSCPCSGCTINI